MLVQLIISTLTNPTFAPAAIYASFYLFKDVGASVAVGFNFRLKECVTDRVRVRQSDLSRLEVRNSVSEGN